MLHVQISEDDVTACITKSLLHQTRFYHTYQSLLVVKCSSPKRTLVKSEVGAAERAPSAAGDLFEVGHCRGHQSPP